MDIYGLLADLVLALHAAFIAFVIGAQVLILLGWWRSWAWVRQPLFRYLHLGAIAFVVLQTWLGMLCPLTILENALRALAGEAGYGRSFIGYWLGRIVFYSAPGWVFVLAYTLFFGLVVATLFAVPPGRVRGSPRKSAGSGD